MGEGGSCPKSLCFRLGGVGVPLPLANRNSRNVLLYTVAKLNGGLRSGSATNSAESLPWCEPAEDFITAMRRLLGLC